MAHDVTELKNAKAAAKALFGNLPGVEGIGIGDDSVRIYVKNEKVQEQLPANIHGVAVEIVTTGDIVAQNR